MMRALLIGALFCALVPYSQPLNVLIYQPTFGHSHVNFVGKVADVLVAAGHHVVIVQTLLDPKLGPGTKKAEVIRLELTEKGKELAHVVDETQKVRWITPTFYFLSMRQMMVKFRALNKQTCMDVYGNQTFMDQLRGYNFDIGFTQPFDACALGLFHALGIDKYNILLSTPLSNSFASLAGAPVALSYVPGMSLGTDEKMNFLERTKNAVFYLFEQYAVRNMMTQLDDYFISQDPTYPGGLAQYAGACFLMPNSEPLFDFPRPTIHKIVNIGGISVPPASAKKLTKEWDEILNRREHTILISFGSLSKSIDMPEEFKVGLVEALKSIPETTFIWKYEDPSDESVKRGAENIVLSKWVPQTDLLGDQRLTGFITHGGAGSTYELALRGKKAIVIPLFGDQHHNAKMINRQGGTILLEKEDLKDQPKLIETIKQLTEDARMEKAAKRLAATIAERPFTPQELLLKYTEFAAKYGPFPQLDPHGRHLSFVTYHLLDVLGLFLLSIFVATFLIVYCLRKLLFSRKLKNE